MTDKAPQEAAEKLTKETREQITFSINEAVSKLAEIQSNQLALQTEQIRTIQQSLTLLQRQIDVLNERVAVVADQLFEHLEGHT